VTVHRFADAPVATLAEARERFHVVAEAMDEAGLPDDEIVVHLEHLAGNDIVVNSASFAHHLCIHWVAEVHGMSAGRRPGTWANGVASSAAGSPFVPPSKGLRGNVSRDPIS